MSESSISSPAANDGSALRYMRSVIATSKLRAVMGPSYPDYQDACLRQGIPQSNEGYHELIKATPEEIISIVDDLDWTPESPERIKMSGHRNYSLVCNAAEAGRPDILKPLIERGANHPHQFEAPHEIHYPHAMYCAIRGSHTDPHHFAPRRGSGVASCVAMLLEDKLRNLPGGAKRSPGFLDKPMGNGGNRPLHWAALNENEDLCRTLMQFGASPDIKNAEGKLPAEIFPAGKRAGRLSLAFTTDSSPLDPVRREDLLGKERVVPGVEVGG